MRFTLKFSDPAVIDTQMPKEGFGTLMEAEAYANTYHYVRYLQGQCEIVEVPQEPGKGGVCQ